MLCPICDAAMPRGTVLRPGLPITRCPACGFVAADLDQWTHPYTDTDYYTAPSLSDIEAARTLAAYRVAGIRRFVERGTAVDLGCGMGATAIGLAAAGFRASGVDDSRKAIDFLRVNFPQVEWHAEGIAPFLGRGGHFDVITLFHVLEHIPQPGGVVELVRQALTPRGLLVVEVPNVAGLHARLQGSRWQFWLDHHVNYFDLASLERLMRRSGLVLRHVEGKYHFSYPQGIWWRDAAHNLLARAGFKDMITTYWQGR